MKKTIKQIVIVEGKTDTNKLKKLFNVETIETNGSALTNETFNLINIAAKTRGIILLLDPDTTGEKIRKEIINHLEPNTDFVNLFITKKDMTQGTKKIGIAEATDSALLYALEKELVNSNNNNESLSWNDYLDLNLNTKSQRLIITNALNISYANHKQLFKRLNMLNISKNDILKIKEKYENRA